MLTPKQMQSFKKVNISKNAEKTKARIEEDFKSTTKENKNIIFNLSGLKRATFYRVFDTGAATARVVLSMAQTLNVSPYYYIGTEDKKGEYSDEILMKFLQEHGYENLIKETKKNGKPKRRYNRKRKNEAVLETDIPTNTNRDSIVPLQPLVNESNTTSEPDANTIFKPLKETNETIKFTIVLDDSQKMRDAIENLDEETAVLLLKALIRRADANENAKLLCDLVKHCLLS